MTATANTLKKARSNRLGFRGYAKILFAIHKTPGMTTAEVGIACKRNTLTIGRVLNSARTLRLVRREKVTIGLVTTFRWFLGEDADKTGLRGQVARPLPKLIAMATALHTLREGMTPREFGEAVGYNESNARRLICELRKPGGKLLRVCRWERREGHHGPAIPVWQYAPGLPDAPKPEKKDRAAVNREWRARARAKREQLAMLHAIAGNASIFRIAA